MKAVWNCLMNRPGQHSKWDAQKNGRRETIQEVIAQIGPNPFPQNSIWLQRKQSLHRDKYGDDEGQLGGQIDDRLHASLKLGAELFQHESRPGKKSQNGKQKRPSGLAYHSAVIQTNFDRPKNQTAADVLRIIEVEFCISSQFHKKQKIKFEQEIIVDFLSRR